MSEKYAIHRFDFMYNDEWYDVERGNDTLYDIVDDEQTAYQVWANLERESLNEYPLASLSTFNSQLSAEQYQQLATFIKEDCGLPLPVKEDGYFDADDVPIDKMSDEQLLTFLQLAQSNHYTVKEYVALCSRYVIWMPKEGYFLQDPVGYSDSVWFTYDNENVIEQYLDEVGPYYYKPYESHTKLTHQDLQNPIVQSLINQYQEQISIDYNSDNTEATIDFANSDDEVVKAFNAVIEQPTYLIKEVDDMTFAKINRGEW
ncbi:hypothetical protein [Psychrobacter sp. I-STPA10]|uniref:hypothetical protein n=1 Tax=Psychrobacter sp. I-STPA10 TaxID=2585769 RepID=UPI001E56649A|nr:hypothetical protein [Psychrobacter sp. I-STPA10]